MNARKFHSIMAEVKRNLQDQEEAFAAFDPSFAKSAEVIAQEALEIALSKFIGDMIG